MPDGLIVALLAIGVIIVAWLLKKCLRWDPKVERKKTAEFLGNYPYRR